MARTGATNGFARKYLPSIQGNYGLDGSDLYLTTLTGSGTTASLAQNASATVTVTHTAPTNPDQSSPVGLSTPFWLNVLPEVTSTTSNVTIAISNVTRQGFTITLTNTQASAQTINYSWVRVGL